MTGVLLLCAGPVALGLLALYAPQIESWCDRKLATSKKG